ncbi:MAG: replicative DNA helicase [Candidatus Hydrogenedens sp.]
MADSRTKDKSKRKSSITFFDREPPQSIESERAVLGAVFLDPDTFPKVLEIFNYNTDNIFYYGPHQTIFEAMYDIYHTTQSKPDLQAVAGNLETKKLLADVGGISYLTELSSSVPTSANITYYANIVIENALKRKLIEICGDVISKTYDGQTPFKELADEAESSLFTVAMQRRTNPIYKLGEFAASFVSDMEERVGRKETLTGVPTNFPELDDKLCGLQYSEMIVLAARPSVGKTAFALNIARNVAKRGIGVLIFSLEMSKELLLQRLICMEGQIDGQKMRNAFAVQKIMADIVEATGRICNLPIFIDDTPSINVIELRSKARKHLYSNPEVQLIIIDYLQLMNVHRRGENRQVEIAEISRQIKGLARELKVPILTLCQLSREAEKESSEPKLSHLRESGAIEQDADVVLMLYQDKKEEKSKDTSREEAPVSVHLKIAKQRNGPTGIIDFFFHRRYQSFLEVGHFIGEEPSSKTSEDDEESPI